MLAPFPQNRIQPWPKILFRPLKVFVCPKSMYMAEHRDNRPKVHSEPFGDRRPAIAFFSDTFR